MGVEDCLKYLNVYYVTIVFCVMIRYYTVEFTTDSDFVFILVS